MSQVVVFAPEYAQTESSSMVRYLLESGVQCRVVEEYNELHRLAREHAFDVCLAPGKAIRDIADVVRINAHRARLVAFGANDASPAARAIREGAHEYFVAGSVPGTLLQRLQSSELYDEGYVVRSPSSKNSFLMAHKVAATQVSVLVTGESGTGKEVLARYIHEQSLRNRGPFVAVNCAAIPENLLEATMFGYVKGAFTGAVRAQKGKFLEAQAGTLLLDEISEMPLPLQAKLLRVLQERVVEPVGGRSTPVDVRLIATSNLDLKQAMQEGRFREDLYYRLNVFPLHLSPLRERTEDIQGLAEHFVSKYACQLNAQIEGLGSDAIDLLEAHPWPGNVRELENAIQRALVLATGTRLTCASLTVQGMVSEPGHTADEHACVGDDEGLLQDGLKRQEYELISAALVNNHGRRGETAKALGISQRTLRYKLQRLREAGMEILT